METDNYDVIVIGSGIGGLTAASILTKLAGKRVLVLERHFRLGGFTHEFQRKGYRWDVGLHYVGGMAPPQQGRQLMNLVTGNAVDWDPMPPNFEVFHYPGLDFEVPSEPKEYQRRLIEAFPHERRGIEGYFRDVKRAAAWYGRETFSWGAWAPLKAGMTVANARTRRLALRTTAEQIGKRVRDVRLRALLTSQWGDYGLTPTRSAFAIHALIVEHYLRGGWFPHGGSEALAEAANQVIETGGGSCRINHEVTSLILEDGRAVGVRAHVRKGRGGFDAEFRAPIVISDAGAHTTYTQLVPAGLADDVRAKVEAAEPSVTAVTAYLGLRESPAALGFAGENHWCFDGFDHEARVADWQGVLDGRPNGVYLSFPSLKDRAATKHTAEIITFVEWSAFAQWAGTEWMRRGADYDQLKERIGTGLLSYVEKRYPGFGALVEHVEVSTPLTVATFTGQRNGQIYGMAVTPQRLRDKLTSTRTPVPGLLLAGADVCSPGIMGALMGGVFAAADVLGPSGFPLILKAARAS